MSKIICNTALIAAISHAMGTTAPIYRNESPEQGLAHLKAAMDEIKNKLRAVGELSVKDIQNMQHISNENRAKLDELLNAHNELKSAFDSTQQIIADLKTGGAANAVATFSSPGMTVTNSDEFRSLVLARGEQYRGTLTFPVQNVVVSTITGGNLAQPQRLPMVEPVLRRLTIRDLLNSGPISTNAVEYVRETGFTNNANTVAENPNSDKPQSNLAFSLESAKVTTIAHWVNASKQVLSDVGMMSSYIDGRLRYGLALKVEEQLLNGGGTGVDINGLMNQASDFSNPGVTVTQETRIDRLRLAMLQVALAEYDADAIVINPIDWAAIELLKDDNNNYLFASPKNLTSPGLWGLPVVATQAMDVDNYLVGAFRMGAQVWDRESASVQISTENKDNFTKNMVTILAEERLALTVYRPEAFVKGTFESI